MLDCNIVPYNQKKNEYSNLLNFTPTSTENWLKVSEYTIPETGVYVITASAIYYTIQPRGAAIMGEDAAPTSRPWSILAITPSNSNGAASYTGYFDKNTKIYFYGIWMSYGTAQGYRIYVKKIS